jgi:hypothetical protein
MRSLFFILVFLVLQVRAIVEWPFQHDSLNGRRTHVKAFVGDPGKLFSVKN